MNTTSQLSPLDALVLAEVKNLRFAETALASKLSTLTPNDEVSELSFLSSLAEVRDRTRRLERMLDAMAGCGFGPGESEFLMMPSAA